MQNVRRFFNKKKDLRFEHMALDVYREFVADSVIQASGTVEFEDGLRTGVLLQDC